MIRTVNRVNICIFLSQTEQGVAVEPTLKEVFFCVWSGQTILTKALLTNAADKCIGSVMRRHTNFE